MNTETKNLLSRIGNHKDKFYSSLFEKIYTQKELTCYENSCVLTIALILFEEYKKNSNITYYEMSYFLVLNYYLRTKSIEPLLDFSINNGLYPISNSLLKLGYDGTQSYAIENHISRYINKDNKNIVQTKLQFENSNLFLSCEDERKVYIAPTSYGKSELILRDIEKRNYKKIGIIVPKKALIWQFYNLLKKNKIQKKYKLLKHDEEYNCEDKFICIFTQERALNLLQENEVSFDCLYIDEAHNLFSNNERSILLGRLINISKKINNDCKISFLSPLINNQNNLRFSKDDNLSIFRIDKNIKELRIKLFANNEAKIYNRFFDDYYKIDNSENYVNYLDYINKNSKDKNLIYLHTPRDVERLCDDIIDSQVFKEKNLDDDEIKGILNSLKKHFFPEFKAIQLLKKGFVFIHGQMPDSLKEYLLFQFINCKKISHLICNSVILEGMNLKSDSLFILDVRSLDRNSLINLSGRVNRLIDIFSNNDLSKLMCDIHFVSGFPGKSGFKNKILEFRNDGKDVLKNPLLENTIKTEKDKKIIEIEQFFDKNFGQSSIKELLIKNGIHLFYADFDQELEYIEKKIENINRENNIFDLIKDIFLSHKDNIKDEKVRRLVEEKTIKYYRAYLRNCYHEPLAKKICWIQTYFENAHYPVYFGTSFGEIPSPNSNKQIKTCIDVSKKTLIQRKHLSLIKACIEDDFVGFHLNKMVKFLKDCNVITEDEYNNFLYGTSEPTEINLLKSGFSYSLIDYLKNNDLLSKIKNDNGVLFVEDELYRKIIDESDDYIKYQLLKLLN